MGRQARAKPVVKVAVKQGMRTDDSVVDRSKKKRRKKRPKQRYVCTVGMDSKINGKKERSAGRGEGQDDKRTLRLAGRPAADESHERGIGYNSKGPL